MSKKIEKLAIGAIRALCIDMINKANSGHPGMALGSAPILYTLFTKHLVSDPTHPDWINRDRFVLSAGHASSLLYSMLHLCEYGLTIDDLKNFRQLDSLTPGHPEYKHTIGVDATAGPLGQGIAQAVGMAMAEQALAANYPQGKYLCNHYTYCLCGDGCLQEGLSQEAISLAGHQKLNKLILIYDSNKVTLDGKLDLSFSESVKNRFISSGWDVLEVRNGNNVKDIDKALKIAKTSHEKPTLIIVQTVIGYGSFKQGTSKVHGSPLGVEDGQHAKVDVYGYKYPDFYVPQSVYNHFHQTFTIRGQMAYDAYQETAAKYAKKYKNEYKRFLALEKLSVEKYLPEVYPDFEDGESISTRNASNKALNDYMLAIPNLFGGAADVAGSVCTKLNGGVDFTPNSRDGHNINWGIREFAMACAQNGMLLHGGLRTYVGCFLVFSDYMKSAIRTAAISKIPAIYLFSHDSIAVGEDGPTHQPIEHLAMLRSIPNLTVIRPCDIRETYAAWKLALASTETPTALILSRQNLPTLKNSSSGQVSLGGYIISKEKRRAKYTFLATGSEVQLAIDAQKELLEAGIDTRVVSLPSWELFEQTGEDYKEKIFGVIYKNRISIEALSTFGWGKYAKHNIGVDEFGASGKCDELYKKYRITVADIVRYVKELKE